MKAAEDAELERHAAADRAGRDAAREHYDPRAVQEKWQERWAAMDLFRASDDPEDRRPRTYLLDMFPYPSGDLHMGHAEAAAIPDPSPPSFSPPGPTSLPPTPSAP